jgi:hypothetical protein
MPTEALKPVARLIRSLTDLNGGDPPKEVHIPGCKENVLIEGAVVRGGSALVVWPDGKKWVPRAQWVHDGKSGPEVTPDMVLRWEQQREYEALALIKETV